MNKSEYIKELERRLKYIPTEDREDAISYYTEYLDEIELSESEDISNKIGTPKEIAKEIIENATTKAINEQQENKSVKGSGKIVWLVILGIASIPVSLPLVCVALVVAITLMITIFAIVFSFVVAAIAIVFAGFCALAASVITPGFANKLIGIGAGAVMIGVGVLALFGSIALFKLIVKLIGIVFNKRKNKGE